MNTSSLTDKPVGRVLVTGGTGLTGRALIPLLSACGYRVAVLSRNSEKADGKSLFYWNPDNRYIDPAALPGTTHIIHLAGAGIGDRRWSKKRMREITDSRVASAKLLLDAMLLSGTRISCFISASATGFYGNDTADRIRTEQDRPGTDFLASVCKKWEEAADLFRQHGIRTVIVRPGIVLSPRGGFMGRILPPARKGLIAWFGNGKQYFPWIHVYDLCNIYMKALDDNTCEGPVNAVAPGIVTQRQFMKMLRSVSGRHSIASGIPSLLVRLAFGRMSSMLLTGNRVSPAILREKGFTFRFPEPAEALKDILDSTGS
jgi:uncharacterized protein (TIGR01777 family)